MVGNEMKENGRKEIRRRERGRVMVIERKMRGD